MSGECLRRGCAAGGGQLGWAGRGPVFAFGAGGAEAVSVARNRISRLGDLQITPPGLHYMPYTRPFLLLRPVSPSFRHFSLKGGDGGGGDGGGGDGAWHPRNFFLLSRGFWEVERASGEEGEQRVLLEGRGGGGLKVVVIFGREGQGWGGWGHRRHGRGVGKLGALQEACSGNPPRDVNAPSKRGPNPNPFFYPFTKCF